ncbi:MAG: hypothetical protein Q8M23_02520, partial [Bacteroidales bacterium]|nr:hypothetical protein [Bacteroidales bacterium]
MKEIASVASFLRNDVLYKNLFTDSGIRHKPRKKVIPLFQKGARGIQKKRPPYASSLTES